MKFHEKRPDFEKQLNTQNIFVFKDGVFDFDSMTFDPGNPDVPVTMCVAQPYVPYDAEHEHIKTLMGFMEDVLPDRDSREYTLKVLGVCLTQQVLQYFFIWTGKGGNGKGRLVRLMEECLGDYFQAVSPSLLTKRREDANQANEALMALVKARLAVFQEAEQSETLQAGIVKSITGEDTQSSRGNYGRQQKWRALFKSLFVCNEIPSFSENSLAVWRRVKVTDFPTQFVENPLRPHERQIDYDIDNKLRAAAPYFLGLLIEYYRRFRVEGLAVPALVSAATERYRDSMDVVKEFVAEQLQRSESGHVLWTDLSAAYNRWPQKKHMKIQQLKDAFAKHDVRYQNTSIDGKSFVGVKGWILL